MIRTIDRTQPRSTSIWLSTWWIPVTPLPQRYTIGDRWKAIEIGVVDRYTLQLQTLRRSSGSGPGSPSDLL